MEIAVGFITGAIVLALGFLAGRHWSGQDGLDEARKELALARHEIGVVINILESIGIRFNRDHDRNVTGLVIDAEAKLHGVSELGV